MANLDSNRYIPDAWTRDRGSARSVRCLLLLHCMYRYAKGGREGRERSQLKEESRFPGSKYFFVAGKVFRRQSLKKRKNYSGYYRDLTYINFKFFWIQKKNNNKKTTNSFCFLTMRKEQSSGSKKVRLLASCFPSSPIVIMRSFWLKMKVLNHGLSDDGSDLFIFFTGDRKKKPEFFLAAAAAFFSFPPPNGKYYSPPIFIFFFFTQDARSTSAPGGPTVAPVRMMLALFVVDSGWWWWSLFWTWTRRWGFENWDNSGEAQHGFGSRRLASFFFFENRSLGATGKKNSIFLFLVWVAIKNSHIPSLSNFFFVPLFLVGPKLWCIPVTMQCM